MSLRMDPVRFSVELDKIDGDNVRALRRKARHRELTNIQTVHDIIYCFKRVAADYPEYDQMAACQEHPEYIKILDLLKENYEDCENDGSFSTTDLEMVAFVKFQQRKWTHYKMLFQQRRNDLRI